ncbi:geranylgeranyl reductase family protein [Roseovarius aestuariivivens]|uniref:geranylgeranyl reductase family protein n=1 Tax=Roseovarius aestuariivivens TaxID=1888910 RepID=UPI001080B9C0|nr:geranylgeranyl reductase family protein [Roseovarius aestuariivivens]
MQTFDIVIIGAGPAGAASAVTARKRGLSVALVDKAVFPRAKLCGGLVTGRCAAHLKEVFDLDLIPGLFETRKNFTFHLGADDLGRLDDVPPVHLTMRWDFDRLLYARAIKAGATDFTGRRVENLDLEHNTVTLEGGQVLRYGVLIGADGVQSFVAKALFGRAFDPEKIGFALEIEAPSEMPDEDTPLRIDFAAADWGYGWVFPKSRSTTVGLGGIQARNADMGAALAAYRAKLTLPEGAKVKGHFLPFGEAKTRPGRENVLLAGDAAGFVDPLTGEGIGYAIESGALAAEVGARAIREGRPILAAGYYRAATRPIRTSIAQARMLRPLMFSRRLQPFFARSFAASRGLKRAYMHLLSGDTSYPAILSRVLVRLPGKITRHLVTRGRAG